MHGVLFGVGGRSRGRVIHGKGQETRPGLPNDVEFVVEIAGEQKLVRDGRFLYAAVRDLNGRLLVKKVRMVFVKDTEPEWIVKGLGPGARLHVFGLPRIDLEAVARQRSQDRRSPNMDLPYEIVIVGVYSDAK